MANTTAGGAKVRETNIKKYGSEAAWKVHMQLVGSIGGSRTGVKKGFAANPKLAAVLGSKGGKISKRRPKVV